jgi:voltage-gated potassium channel
MGDSSCRPREVALISFLLRLSLFARTLVRLWRRDPDFRTLVIFCFTLVSGTIFYSLQEGWSVVDALYFSVTTLSTVGLGDLAPTTTIGKLFTVVYIFSGLGLIAGFINTIGKEAFGRWTRIVRNEEGQEDIDATT